MEKENIDPGMLDSEKLSGELRDYLKSLELADQSSTIGKSIVILLDENLIQDERDISLPEILVAALNDRSATADFMPTGMENMVEVEPSYAEMAELIACPLVIKVQSSLTHTLMAEDAQPNTPEEPKSEGK